MSFPRITSARLVRAPEGLQRTGLLGFVRVVLDDQLVLDGLTLRRTAAGSHSISYPERRDGRGVAHPVIRPTSEPVRVAIEAAVLNALRAQGDLP